MNFMVINIILYICKLSKLERAKDDLVKRDQVFKAQECEGVRELNDCVVQALYYIRPPLELVTPNIACPL